MVTATQSTSFKPVTSSLRSLSTELSSSGFFQIGKYFVAVRMFVILSFFAFMKAAFVLAPPMSQPMTLAILYPLLEHAMLTKRCFTSLRLSSAFSEVEPRAATNAHAELSLEIGKGGETTSCILHISRKA